MIFSLQLLKNTFNSNIKAIALIVLNLLLFNSYSQTLIRDEDTISVNEFNKQAISYQKSKIDTAILLSTRALTISQKIRWQRGEVLSEIQIAMFYQKKKNYMMALTYLFKAIQVCNLLIQSTNLPDCLCGKQLITIVQQNIASTYFSLNNYNKAILFYQLQLNSAERLMDKKEAALSLLNISRVYSKAGNYAKELEYKLKCMKILNELKDKKMLVQLNNGLGIFYLVQKDNNMAMEYFNKSLNLAKQLNDSLIQATVLVNIGIIHSNKKNYSEALECYFKSIKLFQRVKDTVQQVKLYNSIGITYFMQNEYSLTEKYYFEGLRLAESADHKDEIALMLSNIGSFFLETKKYEKAKVFLNRALHLSKEVEAKRFEMHTEESLSALYEKMGNTKLSLWHYKKYIQLKDSLFSQENSAKITQLAANNEFEKQKALEDIKVKNKLEKQELVLRENSKRNKTIITSIAIILFLTIAFSFFSVRSLRLTRRQKEIIELKNKLTEEQKLRIEEKHTEITDSINYAKKIQNALLTNEKYIQKNLVRLINKS